MPTIFNLIPNSAKVMATSGVVAVRLIIRVSMHEKRTMLFPNTVVFLRKYDCYCNENKIKCLIYSSVLGLAVSDVMQPCVGDDS